MKRNNKKRNTALLIELLVRHISKCWVEGKQDEANKALLISKKYFSESSPLKRELDLFGSTLKTTVKSKESAQKIVNAVCENASKMNARQLDEWKSKLIKEINYTFNSQDIYNYKIPNYTVYASVQTLFNEARNKKKTLNIVDKVKLEETIVEHLIRVPEQEEESLKVNPNYSNTVYKFLTQRFNEKYKGKINESQKKLLMNYAAYLISNKDQLIKEYIKKESDKIKNSLKMIKDENIKKDQDLMKKINECCEKFSSNKFETINDQNILELLQYQTLIEEVES